MARFFLSAAALAAIVVAVSAAPMRRLQTTTSGPQGSMLPAAQPDAQLAEMRDAWNNGLDVMKTFTTLMASPGMKVIGENAKFSRKLVETYPLLKAFQGFNSVTADASDDVVKKGFGEGLKAILTAMPEALKTMKDPTISTKTLSSMLDGDENFKALFEAADAGDKAAMEDVEKELNGKLYPMFNTEVFKELTAANPLGKLVQNNEIMRILDQDPIVSKALRDPGHLDQFVKEYAASRRR